MLRLLFGSIGWLVIATLAACSGQPPLGPPPPKPISAIHLDNSQVRFSVDINVHADTIRVKDLRGNTICFKKNVELSPPLATAKFGFCTVNSYHTYVIETTIGDQTYTDRIYSK